MEVPGCIRANPKTLFDGTAAGATLAKTLWPGTYTNTLPSMGSGDVSDITSSGSTIGGIIAVPGAARGLLLDFAGVGAADETLVVEIGKLNASGAIAEVMASVSLKSITTSGTVADTNPFTGTATSSVTWRLFDLATITEYGRHNQVVPNVNGTENNLPCQLMINAEEGVWYYVLVTSLGALTRVICAATISSTTMYRVPAISVTADTEFPAAAVLADNTANPTTSLVGSCLMVWDGSTWDRGKGDSTDGTLVNLGTNNDVTVTGTVTVDSELPAAAAATDNFANPTAPGVLGFGMLWDGATWDRAKGDSTDGALVNLGTNNDVTVTSGTITTVTSVTAIANALPAGTNNIGDVDVLSIAAGDNNIGNVDVLTINAVAPAFGAGTAGATVLRVTQSSDDAGVASLGIMDDWDNAASDGASVSGDVAHDAADAGEPVKIGYRAIAHGTNPTAVAAGNRTNAYANRAGIPFMIGGHPNVITHAVRVLDSDGAQTDIAIVTVGGGTKIVVTRVCVTADGSNTGPTNIKVGFGATTLTTPNTTTAGTQILADFLGVPAGGGLSSGNGGGILGVGADGEDLRYTCEDPVGGAITIMVSYYTVES